MEFSDEFDNFLLDKDIAYTEDQILICNIFVYDLPKWVTEDQLSEYFKKFGKVVSVRLLKECRRAGANHAVRMGFVNFSEPQAAAKALQNRNHPLHRKYIKVRACDSWHQPNAPRTNEATAEVSTREEEAYILNMNNDCLETIFKYLKMPDKISLAGSCQRMRDIFEMHCKTKYKTLNLENLELLTLWKTRQFLEMAGPHIKKLVGRMPRRECRRVIEFLGTYCVNVESVSIQSTTLAVSSLRKLLKNMRMVTNLELYDVELQDSCIPALKNLKHLKKLSLADNYDLTGRNIADLTTLTSLSLHGCHSVTSASFRKICENLADLDTLDIHECSLLQSEDIQHFVKHSQKIKHLQISCDNVDVECVAYLPKLKVLQLYTQKDSVRPLNSQIFAALAKHRANQLEILGIYASNTINSETASLLRKLKKLKWLMCPNNDKLNDSCLRKISKLRELEVLSIKNCKGFTENGLLNLIRKCNNLKTLNVTKCKALNNEFAKNVLTLLKSMRTQRKKSNPLKILLPFSGISPYIVRTTEFASQTDLLKFSFDCQLDADFSFDVDSDSEDIIYYHDDYNYYNVYVSDPDDDDDFDMLFDLPF